MRVSQTRMVRRTGGSKLEPAASGELAGGGSGELLLSGDGPNMHDPALRTRRRHSSLVYALARARRGTGSVADLLEALPDEAVVLDSDGVIVHTNGPWRELARVRGAEPAHTDRGARYLDVCGPHDDTQDTAEVRDMLAEVLAGRRARWAYEHACHSESERRWFLMRAEHLAPGGALVIHTNITARKLAELQAEELANHDPLTGALNRRGFALRLAAELARRRRHGTELSAVMLDCDDFKEINSRYGHLVGDLILVELARRFRESLRGDDVLARIGGDEMLVLLPDTPCARSRQVAERLRLAVSTRSFGTKHGQDLRVTCSAAVVCLPESAADLDDILLACRDGLARSKAAGKNRVSGDEPMEPPSRERLFSVRPRVVRQPIVDLHTGACVGYELLTRGQGELETPTELFRRAIELDALQRIDRACLHAGMARLADLAPELLVHVNVYPSTLLSLDVDDLADQIAALPGGRRLCVELCEQEIFGDPGGLRPKVQALRAAGISLAIDDVGFGRTSLENLIVLEPEIIKVDRRLVHGVAGDAGKARQLSRMVRMGLALQAKVLVEGVECAADATMCMALGATLGQGYLWGRPESF